MYISSRYCKSYKNKIYIFPKSLLDTIIQDSSIRERRNEKIIVLNLYSFLKPFSLYILYLLNID